LIDNRSRNFMYGVILSGFILYMILIFTLSMIVNRSMFELIRKWSFLLNVIKMTIFFILKYVLTLLSFFSICYKVASIKYS
ncbi:hypothetical protein C7P72_01900, partial [Staphylococcus aureus]